MLQTIEGNNNEMFLFVSTIMYSYYRRLLAKLLNIIKYFALNKRLKSLLNIYVLCKNYSLREVFQFYKLNINIKFNIYLIRKAG